MNTTTRIQCPTCGRNIAVRANGTLYTHGPRTNRCPGKETMNNHSDIIRAYHEPTRYPRPGVIGGKTIPAGWALYWVQTGTAAEMQTVRYATQQEAEARIPEIIEAREQAARSKAARQQEAATKAATPRPGTTTNTHTPTKTTPRRLTIHEIRAGKMWCPMMPSELTYSGESCEHCGNFHE